jgi:hypothetical protein
LNNFQVVFDRPQYSLEEDPANKLAAERRFFDLQRLSILETPEKGRSIRIAGSGGLCCILLLASL